MSLFLSSDVSFKVVEHPVVTSAGKTARVTTD
jgi:hypothetical protein